MKKAKSKAISALMKPDIRCPFCKNKLSRYPKEFAAHFARQHPRLRISGLHKVRELARANKIDDTLLPRASHITASFVSGGSIEAGKRK